MSDRSTSIEYMFLVFSRERYEVVTAGSTTVAVPESSTAERLLEKLWNDSNSPGAQSLHDGWSRNFESFIGSIVREPFSYKDDTFEQQKTVTKVRVTFPDGAVVDEFEAFVDNLILARFTSEHGEEPTEGKQTFEQWKRSVQPTVSNDHVMWRCSAIHPDGSVERLPHGDATRWFNAVPLVQVVRALNEYGSAGWSVVESSQDKGVYRGVDSSEAAAPVEIRYLLRRSTRLLT